jgi:cytochrome bd ubiquinol oxidase subunit II
MLLVSHLRLEFYWARVRSKTVQFDLPFICAGLIAFAVLAYVILDGFDLGVGILFPFAKSTQQRDLMMNSVAPVWDGNETWLVLGGGGLMAAFPLAYSIVLPALYAPIIAMLVGLILRGVAFEFRWRIERGKFLWDWAFAGGSIMATMAQGIALGALVQGIPVIGRAYAGGWWHWLTPFSILTGVALLFGYALLGSTWLIMKTTGDVQEKSRKQSIVSAIVTLMMMGAVSLYTPFIQAEYFARWFNWPTLIFSLIVPILVIACAWLIFTGINAHKDYQPFLASLGLFVLGFAGIVISFYPNIVPPSLSIWQTAAPDKSLAFLLWGAMVLVPIILIYTGYSYWVFSGKLNPDEGYH